VVDGIAGLLLAVGVWALFYARPAAVKRLTSA
jgi:hypothetical protein